MAMTAPTVVNQNFAQWMSGRQQQAITFLGTVATSPQADPSIQGGFATLYYDQIANNLCVDNVS